jgi:O-antigen/teichoic acid export membrane protein
LGYLKGPYEVGLYSVAASISLLLTLIPEIFTSLFFPLISKSYAENKTSLVEELSKQVNKWIFLIILPAVVIIFIFPGAIINILFGQEYLFASDALRILLIGIFISAISVIPQQIIKTSGESKVILYGVAICSLLNLILNFIFIPIPKIFLLDNQSGLVGAAIATSLSLSVLTIIFYMKVYSITKIIPIRRKMIIGFLAAVVPVYVMLYLRNNMQTNIINIIIISLFYLILYLLFIFIFKGFDRYDLEILSKYLKKGESFFRKKKEKDI